MSTIGQQQLLMILRGNSLFRPRARDANVSLNTPYYIPRGYNKRSVSSENILIRWIQIWRGGGREEMQKPGQEGRWPSFHLHPKQSILHLATPSRTSLLNKNAKLGIHNDRSASVLLPTTALKRTLLFTLWLWSCLSNSSMNNVI